MEPINYSQQVLDPIMMALDGAASRLAEQQAMRQMDQQDVALGQGQQRIDMAGQAMAFEQERARMADQERAAAEQGQRMFADFIFSPNKTAEMAKSVVDANPALAGAVMEFWQGQNADQQSAEVAFGKQFTFALNKDPEQAKAMLEQRAERLEASGDKARADAYQAQVQLMDTGPQGVEAVKAQSLAIMAGIMDPKDLQLHMEVSGYSMVAPEEPDSVVALRIRAQEAGLQPGTPEYQDFMAKGGDKGPQVVVNTGEKSDAAFDKELATGQAKMFQALVDTGATAKRSIGQIDQLSNLLQQTPTGAIAALQKKLGEYGINTEGLSDIQTFEAIINQLVPLQRPPGSGPMSDRDLELFKASLPRLINQPGGNAQILQTMRGIADYSAKQAQIAEKVVTGEIDRAEGIRQLAALPNPLGGGDMGSAIGKKVSDFVAQNGGKPPTPAQLKELLTPEEMNFVLSEGQ